MKKRRIGLIAFLLAANLAFATETDAEILKDLDFFAEFDVFREGAVFEDVPMDDDAAGEGPAVRTTKVGGS